MGTITLSVPDELKHEMDETDFVNWSSVARKAFAGTLADIKTMEQLRKVREISEISETDTREVKEPVAKEAAASAERIAKGLRSGKIKPKTPQEFRLRCLS